MLIRDVITRLKKNLSSLYDEREVSVITWWVTESITGFNRASLLIHKEDTLTPEQELDFLKKENELMNHCPVQYVLGEAWFAGMKFFVDERVLIPRPETEELVEWVAEVAGSPGKYEVRSEKGEGNNRWGAGNQDNTVLKILDIGTGSGCIPIALKKKLPAADIWAVDISASALDVARMNAENLRAQVTFKEMNILDEDNWNQLPVFDIIISNPPYVPDQDKLSMSLNVLKYEPPVALFVNNADPLLFYRTIIRFTKYHLQKNGLVFFEIHENMHADMYELLHMQGFININIRKDLQGRYRMVRATYGD